VAQAQGVELLGSDGMLLWDRLCGLAGCRGDESWVAAVIADLRRQY
jgi:hypothetical protein